MGDQEPVNAADFSPDSQPLAIKFDKNYNPQPLCPLFSRIPNEIRNKIFAHALTEYADKTKPYSRRSAFYRPGYEFHKLISTTLLLTCRRIYLEAHLVPLAINEHVFWCTQSPTGRWNSAQASTYFQRLTHAQRQSVATVHLFGTRYWNGKSWRHDFAQLVYTWLKKLVLTLRHEHWAFFHRGQNYGFDPILPVAVTWDEKGIPYAPSAECPDGPFEEVFGLPMGKEEIWGRQFQNMHGLKELRIDFEAVETRRKSLDPVVQFARNWRFDLWDGRVLSTEGTQVVERRWKGLPPRESLMMVDSGFEYYVEAEVEYCVLVMTWRARTATAVDEERRGLEVQPVRTCDAGAVPWSTIRSVLRN